MLHETLFSERDRQGRTWLMIVPLVLHFISSPARKNKERIIVQVCVPSTSKFHPCIPNYANLSHNEGRYHAKVQNCMVVP